MIFPLAEKLQTQRKIEISVIVVTKNEEQKIRRCLSALSRFSEVWVVDSGSFDKTQDIARECGARVQQYEWNGVYPKKRQWCLENLDLLHERIFFVDADEIVTPELVQEISALDWNAAGYFVKGLYTFDGKLLRHGLCNNKLVLFDRCKFEFPVIDDLDLEGMGEIEGHYQPILKRNFIKEKIGQIYKPMIHEAYEDAENWERRHWRYAHWESGMNRKDATPYAPNVQREFIKRIFRTLPFRGVFAFLHSYIFKFGILDGKAGYKFAKSRARYYQMIASLDCFKRQ